MVIWNCFIQSKETYTNYTWVSHLVPVLEMMFGVTRHSLSFNVRCQAKLYKEKYHFNLPHTQMYNAISLLPSGMLFVTTWSTRLWDPPISGCKKVPWPILSGGRLNSKFDSSCCDGTCSRFCWNVISNIMWPQILNNIEVILLRGAVTTSVHSSWPLAEREEGLCRGRP